MGIKKHDFCEKKTRVKFFLETAMSWKLSAQFSTRNFEIKSLYRCPKPTLAGIVL